MSHKVPAPRSDVREEKFVVTLPDRTEYLVTVHTSTDSVVYFFGGATSYCVECQVHLEDSRYAPFVNIHHADISRVYYEDLCCLNRRFMRGGDTQKLLLLVISFIRNTHPHITGFILSDTSSRQCGNGDYVNLALMHYLQDGLTWYASHFGAQFADEDDIRKLHTAEDRIRQAKPVWGKIRSYIFSEFPISEEELRLLYESHDALTFFRELNKRIGVAEFCSFISRWIDQFIRDNFKFTFSNIKFVIPITGNHHINPPIEYTKGPYQSGGKRLRQTRKRSKASRYLI